MSVSFGILNFFLLIEDLKYFILFWLNLIFFLEFKIQKYFFSIKYFYKFSPIFPLAPVIRIFIGWNLIK